MHKPRYTINVKESPTGWWFVWITPPGATSYESWSGIVPYSTRRSALAAAAAIAAGMDVVDHGKKEAK